MSIESIIGGGIRLVRTQPHVVAIWAALYVVVGMLGYAAMRPLMASTFAFQQQMAANAAAGIRTPPMFPPGLFPMIFGIDFLFVIAAVIAFAAAVRAVTWPTGDRFAYLRFGMDELRLIGLGILLVVAFFVAELVVILGMVLIGGALGAVAGKVGASVVVGIFVIALILAMIYVEVRLSLAGVFTVVRRQITIGPAWRATRGQFWTLFGAYVVMTVGYMVVTFVIVAITNPAMFSAYASMNQGAIVAAAQDQMSFSFAMIVRFVIAAILATIMLSVVFGAVATAALELGAAGPGADEGAVFL